VDSFSRFAAAGGKEFQGLVEATSMSERENIMGRIRAALQSAASRPGSHRPVDHALPANKTLAGVVQQWLPRGGGSFEEQCLMPYSRFCTLCSSHRKNSSTKNGTGHNSWHGWHFQQSFNDALSPS
jgi:hypothetical protein